MNHSPRILIISGLRVFPTQTGGHLRSGSFAKAMARLGMQVQIYSLAGRRDDYGRGREAILEELEPGLTEYTSLSLPFGICQALAHRLALPRLWQYSLLAAGMVPRSLKQALNWADLIVSDLPFVPTIPGPWRQKPWFLLSHNLEYRLLEQGAWLDRQLWSRLTRRLECSVMTRYDGVLACAEEDYQFFSARNRDKKLLLLIANGIDSQLYRPDPSQRHQLRLDLGVADDERLIVLSGSRYAPNLEALQQLAEFIEQERDFLSAHKIRFLILGSMAKASRSQALIATGFVASTLAYFQAADFAINPTSRGSGSNVKVFEYIASHLPILSTAFGVRGTGLVAERDYLPFDWNSLKSRLLQLVDGGDSDTWQAYAAAVWQRHSAQCDMTEIVRQPLREILQRHGIELPKSDQIRIPQ